MLLEQINRRLITYASQLGSEVKVKKLEAPAPGEYKIIGVAVDSETYAKLLVLMQNEGIKQVKSAALEAMKRGLR